MKPKTFTCDICGQTFPCTQQAHFDGQDLCPGCLDEETVVCFYCGERIWQDDNSGTDGTPLCERCYERHYVHCTRCGTLMHTNDVHYEDDDTDAPYCPKCYRQIRRAYNSPVIQDYYFKPTPFSLAQAPAFFASSWKLMGPVRIPPTPENSLILPTGSTIISIFQIYSIMTIPFCERYQRGMKQSWHFR